jgi:hypothetical protein
LALSRASTKPVKLNDRLWWKPSWFVIYDIAMTILGLAEEPDREHLRELFPLARNDHIERAFALAEKERKRLAKLPQKPTHQPHKYRVKSRPPEAAAGATDGNNTEERMKPRNGDGPEGTLRTAEDLDGALVTKHSTETISSRASAQGAR